MNARGIARIGTLAAGLGIGAAVAAMPGTAAADSSTDWLSSIDSLLVGSAAPAADTSDLNLAISIDGATLFQEGTAEASSGTDGDIAIAYGAGAVATATGTDDYAAVDGTDSSAVAGGPGSTEDTAFVYGDDSGATAGGYGDNPGNFDGAITIGNDDFADSGSNATGAGSYDVAYIEGNDLGTADAQGTDYLIDILKTYEDASTSTTTAAAESSNFLTDLLSSVDGASAAADSTSFLSELASLF